MAKVLDYGLEVREFKPHLSYNVHFQTNTLRKVIHPLIRPSMCWIVPLLFLKKDDSSIK